MRDDVTRNALPMPPPLPEEACLVLLHGHGELGRRYTLRDGLTIGRAPDNDLMLDLEDVSRQHARFTPDQDAWSVEDLGSTNGVQVNGVEAGARTPLKNGDLVKVGRAIFKYLSGGNIEALFHEEIYHLTVSDALTKVPNKRYLLDFLDRELARAARYHSPLSVVMLDLDHFKQLNDRFGHLAGDEVLATLAGVISACIRREQLFARFGGEEFCMVLPELEPEQVEGLCESARLAVEKTRFRFEDSELNLTISLGAAAYAAGMSRADLLAAADTQLYRAKHQGRNQWACAWAPLSPDRK